MYSSALLATCIAALAASGTATRLPARDSRHAQLRVYSQGGCSEGNLGELGLYDADVNTCVAFFDGNLKSVLLQFVEPGCQLQVYSDLACELDRRDPTPDECLTGDEGYRSYILVCDN